MEMLELADKSAEMDMLEVVDKLVVDDKLVVVDKSALVDNFVKLELVHKLELVGMLDVVDKLDAVDMLVKDKGWVLKFQEQYFYCILSHLLDSQKYHFPKLVQDNNSFHMSNKNELHYYYNKQDNVQYLDKEQLLFLSISKLARKNSIENK